MNNTAHHSDDKITKKTQKNSFDINENHLFKSKERGKKIHRGDFKSKMTQLTPPR